ncbi:MAG: glycosyltransferase [Polyangiaceae bacterium]
MSLRLAHLFSSDLGIPASLPYVELLRRRGWEITFFTPPGPRVARLAEIGAKLMDGSGSAPPMRWVELDFARKMDPLGDLRVSARLLKQLATERFDVVHTHATKPGLVGRVLGAVVRSRAVVHTVHGQLWSLETPLKKRLVLAGLDKIASFGTHAVLCQSNEDLAALRTMRVIDARRLLWIGNGIDLGRFDPAAISAERRAEIRREIGVAPDEVAFFSAGRLVHLKGFAELFEAAARARKIDRRVRLVVAGVPDDTVDSLEPHLIERARGEGVIILPETNKMPELYAASDVVVLASIHEGVPRVLMEGAAMGKPLLASNACGCREVVTAGETGLFANVRDAGSFTEAMLRYAGDARLREQMGAFNVTAARQRWDVRRSAARVAAAYDAVLAGRLPSTIEETDVDALLEEARVGATHTARSTRGAHPE